MNTFEVSVSIRSLHPVVPSTTTASRLISFATTLEPSAECGSRREAITAELETLFTLLLRVLFAEEQGDSAADEIGDALVEPEW